MPHKRNPIASERLCGLARVLHGYMVTGLENVPLWHERDISHSSSERIVLPDASLAAYYAIRLATKTIERLDVFPERMLENLDRSYGLVFSQPVLLALVEGGMTRDDAYRIVQRDARAAWDERRSFRTVLEEDPEVSVKPDQLDQAFSLEWSLRNIGSTFDALDEVDA
jgi:adenylosuccinate lyase